eukprot:jgi/Mesvir1/13778/Mv25901-RA.1
MLGIVPCSPLIQIPFSSHPSAQNLTYHTPVLSTFRTTPCTRNVSTWKSGMCASFIGSALSLATESAAHVGFHNVSRRWDWFFRYWQNSPPCLHNTETGHPTGERGTSRFPPPPPSRFSIQGCQLGDGTFLSSGLGWVAVTVTRLCGASSSGSDSSDSSESSSNPLGGPPCASSFGGSSSDSSPVCGTSNDERRN